MLAAALPGVREIRSALAGGYLWIVFIWMILDPSLGEGDFKAEPFQSAHHLGNDLGPVALGVAVTFAAYLIGTFFNELRSAIARLYLRARRSASSLSKQQRESALEEAAHRNAEVRERVVERLKKPFESRTSKEGAGDRDHSGRRPAAEQLLSAVVAGVALPFEVFISAFSQYLGFADQLSLAIVRALTAIRLEPYSPFVTGQGVAAIERYLQHNQVSTWAACPGVADVISDFPVIRTRLIHRSPDTVSEYDRLRAEADFRSAIVLPLFAIICVFSVKVSWVWIFSSLLLLILLTSARTKRREGGDILADALGVVEAPSVEAGRERHEATSSPPPTGPKQLLSAKT